MALFKPFKIESSELESLPIREGQLIFVTDTQTLYIDTSASERVRVNDDALIKLATVETNANAYVLPQASTTLGGVRTTSTQSDLTYYDPAPISNGIVYIKNAPTVTEFNNNTATFHYTGSGNINYDRTTTVVVSATQPSTLSEGDI